MYIQYKLVIAHTVHPILYHTFPNLSSRCTLVALSVLKMCFCLFLRAVLKALARIKKMILSFQYDVLENDTKS